MPADPGGMARRFITLSQLRPGLSRVQAASLLGKDVVTGYELADAASGQYKPITVTNPYRSEAVEKNKRSYTVDYYLVGIKVPDGKISDDELVPLVFYNDQLIGSGWDFLDQNIKGKP